MKFLPLASVALGALLATPLSAQTCSNLTVTGDGKAGTELTFELTGGTSNSIALLVVGETAGEFSISFGMLGQLDLGILPPFTLLPMGSTDTNGDVSRTIVVPDIPDQVSLLGQGFTAKVVFNRGITIDFCSSDVEGFNIGGS